MTSEHKSAAELEREVEAQRRRVESRIDEIQEKLSPGQLVDQFMAYARDNGGKDFADNLGRSLRDNPMPVALMGVSLAWLMLGQKGREGRSMDHDGYGRASDRHDDGLALARIAGTSLRRTGHSYGDSGERYAEFADESGKSYRAMTDDLGHRAGHFIDETGSRIRGFTDATGNRVTQFLDETGAALDEAQGWAMHNFKSARHQAADAARMVQEGAGQVGQQVRQQADRLGHSLTSTLDQHPLVGGALAFAVGAALGAVLPRTEQEDRLMGEAADAARDEIGHVAGDVYERGKDEARQVLDKVSEAAGNIAGEVRATAQEVYRDVEDDARAALSTDEPERPYRH